MSSKESKTLDDSDKANTSSKLKLSFSDNMDTFNRLYEEIREEQRRKNELLAAALEDDDESNEDGIKEVQLSSLKINEKENMQSKSETTSKMNIISNKASANPAVIQVNAGGLLTPCTPAGAAAENVRFNKPNTILKHEIDASETPKPAKNVARSLGRFITPTQPEQLEAGSKIAPKSASQKQQQVPRVLCTIDMRQQLNTPISKCLMKSKTDKTSANNVVADICPRPAEPSKNSKEKYGNTTESRALKDHLVKEVFKCIVVNKEEYVILNVLGKGGSSIVYHCYNPRTREEFAVKCVNLSHNPSEAQTFINEVKALKQLQSCDRIIKLHQYQILNNEKRLYVVLEKGGRDFAEILREHARKSDHLPSFMIIYYWMQMLYAVQQMHSQNVIHCDLKPANFIEIRERLKLIDFGISSCLQMDVTSVVKTTALGTFGYISPEALCNDSNALENSPRNHGGPKYKVGFRSDVWSLGCILYEMVYKRTPFAHITHSHARLAAIMDPNHVINYPEASWAPPLIIECVKSCLCYNVKKRPTINELIMQNHDFLNKF